MRAVVHDKYGPPEAQQLAEVERPVPAADEVLIKVHAAAVTWTDCGFRSAEYFVSRFCVDTGQKTGNVVLTVSHG